MIGASKGKVLDVLAERTITLGLGYNARNFNTLGTSVNWTRPPGDLRDQYNTEIFYRFYLNERIAFTPNIQWVINPSLNTAESQMVYLQIRARLDI
jgi:porin